jgi:hypothetical protein
MNVCRAIARDPTMFPDPEAFNPLRWIEPSYPTYQEPLTEYPSIINSTQFGYGRRVCQGQTVADEDLLIGIGSVAWLFTMDRMPEDTSAHASQPDVAVYLDKIGLHSIGMNAKASVSNEELNTGIEPMLPTTGNQILPNYRYPGSFPILHDQQNTEVDEVSKNKKQEKTNKPDPTLDFSTLLIAKPLPFKFNLKPRDMDRAAKVRDLFNKGVENGDYTNSREFWGEKQGKGKHLGWGKI